MPWNTGVFTATNGVYTGTGIWAKDAAAGTKITAAHHDVHDDDLAAGINACVAKDGSNTVTLLSLSGTVNASSGVIKIGSDIVFTKCDGTVNHTNVFLGKQAGNSTNTGGNNTAVGDGALLALTTGIFNSFYGSVSGAAVTTGGSNSGIGVAALGNLTTGSSNTGLGASTLATVTTGSKNVGIGLQADVPNAGSDGQLSIQNAIYGTGNTAGGSSVSTGNLGVFVKAPTARLHFAAGTATAGTAPIKLTAGTVLGTPEDGALEYDGTHLWFTHGVTRTQIV